MSFQVRVLYDFDGEPNSAELSVKTGEILTVTRNDVGEGWWEGVNSGGNSGLFPESYVTVLSTTAPPAMTPPALPSLPRPNYSNDWDAFQSQEKDSDDDDWDDNDAQYSDTVGQNVPAGNQFHDYGDKSKYTNEDTVSESNFSTIDNRGTATKKSLNRFSTFVKSGGETYILGAHKISVRSDQIIRIQKVDENTFVWPQLNQEYVVQITSPKKESKLKGLKSYIAYQLNSSLSNESVSRRYKHFDWLHERLCEKFSLFAIPPLPDKQISGRYEDQFIEHRRLQLQEFIKYVCKHPILSSSDVWQHFLQCIDEKEWKKGKRAAERDPLIGASFCYCIEAPEKELLQSTVDQKIEVNLVFSHNLDAAIKNVMITAVEQIKKHQGPFKRDYWKIGESFQKLGGALISEDKTPTKLPTAITNIGTAYIEIAKYFEEQPKMDWDPLNDRLYLYRGINASFPDILAIHKGSQQKRKECEKNNMSAQDLQDVRRRSDILTYTVYAEINHFKSQRDADMKEALETFLSQQINFYKRIVDKLENTLQCLREA